jgi:hypothetical protein
VTFPGPYAQAGLWRGQVVKVATKVIFSRLPQENLSDELTGPRYCRAGIAGFAERGGFVAGALFSFFFGQVFHPAPAEKKEQK